MLLRQLPCYDLQRLRNLLAALGLAAPAFQTPPSPWSFRSDDRPTVSARP